MTRNRSTLIFLLTLTAIALYLCYLIARPFINPIISATVLAVVFYPLHSITARRLRSPSLAALVSTLIVIVVVLVPLLLLGMAVGAEIRDLYRLLSVRSTEEGGWSLYLEELLQRPVSWLGKWIDISVQDLRSQILSWIEQTGQLLLAGVAGFVGNATSLIVNSVITLFTLFFVFREGKSWVKRLAAIVPLTQQQTGRLLDGISGAIMATVYGSLSVAAAQGSLMALAFWVLGLHSPILWGTVTALVALLPVVGSGLIWVPACVILFAAGQWVKALILAAWGGLVVSTIDNIIRPYVMSGHVKLPTLLVFFAVFGGIKAFGVMGLFLGPVVLAFTIALLRLLREEAKVWQATGGEAEDKPA